MDSRVSYIGEAQGRVSNKLLIHEREICKETFGVSISGRFCWKRQLQPKKL